MPRRYNGNFGRFDGTAPTLVYHGQGKVGKQTARSLEQRYFEEDVAKHGQANVANRQEPVGEGNKKQDKVDQNKKQASCFCTAQALSNTSTECLSMKAITWKAQKVISIETRKGTFVLAQLGPSPFLTIFNLFSSNDSWEGIALEQDSVLFCHAVTKQFLKLSLIREVQEVAPLVPISYPEYWISEDPSNHQVTLWAGTSAEMSFITLGENGGSLIKNDITIPGFKETPVVVPRIPPYALAIIQEHELTTIALYPEFNERLFLCTQLGKKVDPAKELLFGQEIPLAYKKYFQIISGQVPLEELGY